jgi:hypothetical protein
MTKSNDKLRFHIRMLGEGRLQANCSVPPLIVGGSSLDEVRTRVAAVVRTAFGESRPFALMLGRGREAARTVAGAA